MFLRSLKKYLLTFAFNDFLQGELNHIALRFRIFPVFCYFLLAVDMLVFRYISSWRDVAHNMVLFNKIYLSMTIAVVNVFQ